LDERKKKRKAGEKDNAETRRTLRSAESGELRQGVWRADGEQGRLWKRCGQTEYGYNSHEGKRAMRSVNVAKLKDRLSEYLSMAKRGEEVVIRERNLPVAKLVPFHAENATEQELLLVAEGKMRLPKAELDMKRLWRIPTGKVKGNKAIDALLADREESL
jgi:prevent-host-death family protein